MIRDAVGRLWALVTYPVRWVRWRLDVARVEGLVWQHRVECENWPSAEASVKVLRWRSLLTEWRAARPTLWGGR